MSGLTFDQYREASRNWHPDGVESWSIGEWACAVAGEGGEAVEALLEVLSPLLHQAQLTASIGKACNTAKKLLRERDAMVGNRETSDELRRNLANECADIFAYLDILADSADIDLGEAVAMKFNAVSEQNGFPERLPVGGDR